MARTSRVKQLSCAKHLAFALGALAFMTRLPLRVAAETPAPNAATTKARTDECCDTCLAKVTSTAFEYDPSIYKQCTAQPGGICCFQCDRFGTPDYGDVNISSDGVSPQIASGKWLKFKFADVTNVTYMTLKENQKKTTTPKTTDAQAQMQGDYFLICAKSAGAIYFRGWGTDTCDKVSIEHKVEVTQGNSADTCTDVPSDLELNGDTTGGTGKQKIPCNLNRASIETKPDGSLECVCTTEWTGPPTCSNYPTWKWVITIGGGVAALFSIIISVRAFIKSRQKKKAEAENNAFALSESQDIETLQVTPDHKHSTGGKFVEASDQSKPSRRECSL